MKKIFSLLIICLTSLSSQAQNPFSYSAEVAAGIGVGRGPLATATPQFVAHYELGGSFNLGAGAGIRFALPCLQYITKNGTHKRTFCDEFDIPVFLRLGYGKELFYANVDAGYAFGIFSFYGSGWVPGGKKEPCYNGFFVDPHIGIRMGLHSALALGVLLQHSVISNTVQTESGTINDPSYSISSTTDTQNMFTPAITLRYAYIF